MEEEILTEEEIQEAVRKIFKHAQTDIEFRKLCLSDPAEAIREITGKSLPPNYKLRFLDSDTGGAAKTPPQE